MRYLVLLLGLALAGCGLSETDQAIKKAAERAAEAVERNVPEGRGIKFQDMSIIPVRHGAVCGSFTEEAGAPERFWAGGTQNDIGEAIPVLERWEHGPAKNDELFSKYCSGMKPIEPSLMPLEGTGRQTDEEIRQSAELMKRIDKAAHPAAKR